MWVVRHRNFDKQTFGWKKSILPFEWTICVKTGDIIFFNEDLQTINTCQHVRKHRNFPWRKRTKRERRIIETLINNFLVKKKVFCHLNAWSVSNITGDIIFSTRIFRTLIQTINISQMTCRHVPKYGSLLAKTYSSRFKIESSSDCFNFLSTLSSSKTSKF